MSHIDKNSLSKLLSRRKFITALGISGAAMIATGKISGKSDGAPLVNESVYGAGDNKTKPGNDDMFNTLTLSSIADLSGFRGRHDKQQVLVLGFYPDNGQGSGSFYYDANRPKSDHNGGTVISWTVPWNGDRAGVDAFLKGVGESDPSGRGCWIRSFDSRHVHSEWFGAIGNNGDETASFLAAKQFAEMSPCTNLYLPSALVTITIQDPLVFSKQGFGLFGTGVDPYIYTTNEEHVSGLRINGGTNDAASRAALVFDGVGQSAGDFLLLAGPACQWYWPLDTCTYSGDFQRIRSRGFAGGHRLYNSPTYGHEAIANKFERVEMYAIRRGLQIGRNPIPQAQQGACNENTWINCRYRGYEVLLDIYRQKTPRTYGIVFINCIFQETPPVGEGDYELLKTEGSNIEGITFLNGRFESSAQPGRKRPVMNLNGLSSKSLCNFIGTYIHTSITIIDNNNRLRSLGTVLNPNWTTESLEALSLISRGTDEMKNKLNASNAVRWSGTGSTELPTRQWVETPYIARGTTSAGYGGKYRKGALWAENVVEFVASAGDIRETKIWVDGVPMTRTLLSGTEKQHVPASDGDIQLGASFARWSDIYSVTGVIHTSDRNAKQDIQPISDAVLDAWADIQYRTFRFKEAVAEKGNAARKHTGLIAQEIYETFQKHGLDAFEYGLLCVEEQADESTGQNRQVWGIRADECQFLEMAYMRRELSRLKQK
ncbi:tail fiber domain-containing protein [Paenibacillus mesophilus]|uniref:tail fiber domain-containing protein n=1 Tax=Paenibacillus mesophilus TaxID=2582849 RepID=UPI00130510AF|nr:tail fiber domain-containing protein [Paenibacillus mesophilus]